MSRLVDRLRSSLAANKLEQALDVAIAAWRDQRAIALAEAVDAIDATDPTPAFAGSHAAWLKAARAAKTQRDRGALLRAITKRTSGELVPAMKVARAWDDPRLSTQIIALLAALPFSGTRTRDVWRGVFEIAAAQRDPRFLALARSMPATWNVGADTKRFLNNRLAEANEDVAEVALPAEVDAELRAFVAELAKSRPVMPANEESLLAAIYATPDDDGPRLVYSDWLQERGDPRGEFIALQLQPTRDATSEKRMRALLKQHKKAWLGPLAPALGGDLEFRRGFVAKGTAKFRHQRDAEQHGASPAWATVEELDWGHQIVRDDQAAWAHYIHPAMSGLRHVDGAHPRFLLAATTPWRIETLVLGHRLGDRESMRALCESPLLPKLQRLTVGGDIAPDWLDGLSRCPPHLAIRGQLERKDLATWLASARRSPLQRFTILYWIVGYHFTRDADGAFTRLDAEVRPTTKIASLESARPGLEELAKAVRALPRRSLTHFDARIELGGELVPLPTVIEAAGPALRP